MYWAVLTRENNESRHFKGCETIDKIIELQLKLKDYKGLTETIDHGVKVVIPMLAKTKASLLL
jgi:hypothetical protein